MKSYFILSGFLFFCIGSLSAQMTMTKVNKLSGMSPTEWRLEAAKTITPEDLRKHLTIISSDEFEGRETGKSGNEKAANYLSKMFMSYGLVPIGSRGTYFHPIDMVSERWEKIDFTINGSEYRHLWDFFALHDGNSGTNEIITDDFIFVGYGIQDDEINNYRKTDIRGKTVVMYGGEPRDENGISLLTGTTEDSDWTNNPFKKIELAKKMGAETVFIISEQFKQQIARNRRFLIGPSVTLRPPEDNENKIDENFHHVIINPEMAKKMIGKKIRKVKKVRTKINRGKSPKGVKIKAKIRGHMIKRDRRTHTSNVIGLLLGKHPEKKKEHIIVTAHFDHLGKRGDDIFNGADDNGSGTSTVLELAEAFSTAAAFDQGPDRSIIFLLLSGEEKGLLGSKFYTDHPIIPLEQTMANVNIDMVGRVDKKHDNPRYIYVIGADRLSTTLHDINEDVNSKYENLELDYTYNEEDDPNRYYYRSDHYNFAVKGIPAIFFFNGTHNDYHRPSDTIDKIQFDKMSSIGRHIFHLIWELGNRPDAIEVNVK